MKRGVAAGLAVLLAAGAAGAEEPFRLADLGLRGQATLKSFGYFADTSTDERQWVNLGSLQLEWTRRLGPRGAVKLVGEARDDDAGFAHGFHFQIPETTRRRSHLDLREATLSARGGPLEVTVGKQIFAWGTADAFNPTDNLNPYDYLDVLDNEKLGVWSAAARLARGPSSLTFVAVPFFTPSRLPLPESRWTPAVPAGFRVLADDPVRPAADASAVQYAARLKTTLAGWDLSVSYYDGFRDTLAFRQSLVPLGGGAVIPRLTPVYTREKVPGADVSTTFGRVEVHAEVAARLAESDGRDDRFQAIAGFNYTHDVGARWLDQVLLVLEYARETGLGRRDPSIVDNDAVPLAGALLSDRAFRDALAGRVLVRFTEDTAVELTGVADLSRRPSHYIQVKARQRVTDALQAEAGLDFLTGRPDTFWGRWGDNDRVFVVLRYLF